MNPMESKGMMKPKIKGEHSGAYGSDVEAMDAGEFDENVQVGDNVEGTWAGTVESIENGKVNVKVSEKRVGVSNQADSALRSMAKQPGMEEMEGEGGIQ